MTGSDGRQAKITRTSPKEPLHSGSAPTADPTAQVDPILGPVAPPEAKISVQDVEAMIKVKPLHWQQELVKKVGAQSIEQLIQSLADYDDLHFVDSSLSGPLTAKDADAWPLVVVRLTRVRRLLDLSTEHHTEVVGALRRSLADAVKEWPGALRELDEIYTKATANGRTFITSEPMRWQKVQMQGAAAVYLLSILGDAEDLQRILEVHEQTMQMNLAPRQDRVVGMVPPSFTFYGLHRMICTLPLSSVSEGSRSLTQKYRGNVRDVLPEVRSIRTTAWNANRTEFDPRLTYLDMNLRSLKSERMMEMPVFESRFSDGQLLSDPDGLPTQRTDELVSKIRQIVAKNAQQDKGPRP